MSVSRIANRCALRMPGVARTSGRWTLSYHALNSSSLPATGLENTRYVVTAMLRAPVRGRSTLFRAGWSAVKAALHCRRGPIPEARGGELDAALPRAGYCAGVVSGLDVG